jgi:NAD(P)H dehydrogenase (quinone)
MKQNLVKKVLVVLGHPRVESFNGALANAYVEGARQAGAEVKQLDLARLEFAANIMQSPDYDNKVVQALEPSLKGAQDLIRWADHLAFVYPTFWGDMPALLKAFIDRTFLPNFAFKYRKGSPFQDKLLKGKTARIITTMDAPTLYYQLMYRSPGTNALKRATLHFCGVKPVSVTAIGRMRYLSEDARKGWLEKVKVLAARDVAKPARQPSIPSVPVQNL